MAEIKIIDTHADNILEYGVCGYKNINEIVKTAEKEYGLKPDLIELKNYNEAQNSPCAFGTFCILYDGKVIAEHPISNKRFTNIMTKILN